MKERVEKSYQNYESKGLNPEIVRKLKGRTSANTFSGFLLSGIKKSRDNKDWVTAKFLEEIYDSYKKYHPKKLNTVEILEGWKGNDRPEIYKTFENDFKIIMHQKEDGEIKRIEKEIPKENVNRLWQFIQNWEIGETKKCYAFAEILNQPNWREVWKKRTDVYFPLYYYPIKVLQALGLIHYGNKGQITRLK